MISRLECTNKNLSIQFNSANIYKQRLAVLHACLIAVKKAMLSDDEIDSAIIFLQDGVGDRNLLVKKTEGLASKFDGEYLSIGESNDSDSKPEIINLFSKARAASALTFALSEDANLLQEAIYEALQSVGDVKEIELAISSALI